MSLRPDADPDYAYAEFIETLSPEEHEERQRRGDVFAAQIRVRLGWIDYEVRP